MNKYLFKVPVFIISKILQARAVTFPIQSIFVCLLFCQWLVGWERFRSKKNRSLPVSLVECYGTLEFLV